MEEYNPSVHKSNVAVYCPTRELARLLLAYWHSKGYKWADEKPLIHDDHWGLYNEQYYFLDGKVVRYGSAESTHDYTVTYAHGSYSNPEEVYEGLFTMD